jgi:hypothetical protein
LGRIGTPGGKNENASQHEQQQQRESQIEVIHDVMFESGMERKRGDKELTFSVAESASS